MATKKLSKVKKDQVILGMSAVENAVQVKVVLKKGKSPTLKATPINNPDAVKITGKEVDLSGMILEDSVSNTQDLLTSTGKYLITTANGVAPHGLEMKCLWLREGFDWKIIKQGNYQILVPTKK